MSTARSTPAQNERGAARSTRRGAAARAHSASAGPAAPERAVRGQAAGHRLDVRAQLALRRVHRPRGARPRGRSPSVRQRARTTPCPTATAPAAASAARSAPRTTVSVRRRPARGAAAPRPSVRRAATSGPAEHAMDRPSGPRTSVATTTSPGSTPGPRAPQKPATATGVSPAGSRPAEARERSGPMPVRTTRRPGERATQGAPASMASGARTVRPPSAVTGAHPPSIRARTGPAPAAGRSAGTGGS